MDQSLLAGIGNIYSDEILFQAHAHPQDKVDRLTKRQLNQIYKIMKNVLRNTIRYKADPNRAPRSWLLPHRGKNSDCPRCGNKLQRITINQRSAYVCPKCQRPVN
jgi:formamidopyrimidine-DNA glycosylase